MAAAPSAVDEKMDGFREHGEIYFGFTVSTTVFRLHNTSTRCSTKVLAR